MKSSDDQASGLELGADGHITRPIEKRELLARIEAFMRHKRTIDSLVKSEARLRSIIERNPDAILVVDKDGIIRFTNPASEALFKLTMDDLSNRVFGYPIVKGEHSEIEILRQNESTVSGEMRTIDIEWEETDAFLTSIRDLSDRIKTETALRESEEYLRITLDSIGDAVIATDTKGKIVQINPVASKLTGWSAESAVGKNLNDVFKIVNNKSKKNVGWVTCYPSTLYIWLLLTSHPMGNYVTHPTVLGKIKGFFITTQSVDP